MSLVNGRFMLGSRAYFVYLVELFLTVTWSSIQTVQQGGSGPSPTSSFTLVPPRGIHYYGLLVVSLQRQHVHIRAKDEFSHLFKGTCYIQCVYYYTLFYTLF